MLWLIKIILAF